jgi:DNA recombination protein RmuC
MELKVKSFAKDIRDKYIDPPGTTDFGIMFLPTEGLYAEVLRRPGLCDCLQREYRIVATGPTNLIALLNSLQMGFRTLAIEKRSSEVWTLLGTVKTEFGRFGDILDKTQKKLQEASNTIEDAARKSRSIGRKLKNVQELSVDDSVVLLEEADDIGCSQIAASIEESQK